MKVIVKKTIMIRTHDFYRFIVRALGPVSQSFPKIIVSALALTIPTNYLRERPDNLKKMLKLKVYTKEIN